MSLKSWFGGEKSDEKEIKVPTEELDRLKADMQASMAEKEQLTANVTEMKAQVTSLLGQFEEVKGQLATVTAERDEWKLKAEAYGKQPGATPSDPAKTKTDDLNDGDETDYMKIMNGLAHNQEADAALGWVDTKSKKAE
jgi:chromosome segregation ATPase